MRCRIQTPRYSCSFVHVRVELGVGNHVDDAPVLHHVVPVRDGRREAEILLDQQDREALRLRAARWCGRSAARSPARGPRSARRAAAGARRCAGCARSRASAARRRRAWCPGSCAAPARLGKSSKICSTVRPPSRTMRRQQQVLLDVEAREDAALLRAVGDAQARDAVRRQARSSRRPRTAIEPSRRGTMPMIDLQRRRLAGAVAAEQRHHLAGRDVEVDAVQDVRLAVPGVAGRAPRAAARAAGAVASRERGFRHGPLPGRPRRPPGFFDTVA